MSCPLQLTGIQSQCKDSSSIAGVKRVYITPYDNVISKDSTYVYYDVPSDSYLTAYYPYINVITCLDKFYTYEFKKGTASLVSTLGTNDVNDTKMFTNDVMLKFNKITSETRKEIEQLLKGNLVVIVELNSGKFLYLGYDREVSVVNVVVQSSVNMMDFVGYEITLQDLSNEQPFELQFSNNEIWLKADYIQKFVSPGFTSFSIATTPSTAVNYWRIPTIDLNTGAPSIEVGKGENIYISPDLGDIYMSFDFDITSIFSVDANGTTGILNFSGGKYTVLTSIELNNWYGITTVYLPSTLLTKLSLSGCAALSTISVYATMNLNDIDLSYTALSSVALASFVDILVTSGNADNQGNVITGGTLTVTGCTGAGGPAWDVLDPTYPSLVELINVYGWTYVNN